MRTAKSNSISDFDVKINSVPHPVSETYRCRFVREDGEILIVMNLDGLVDSKFDTEDLLSSKLMRSCLSSFEKMKVVQCRSCIAVLRLLTNA